MGKKSAFDDWLEEHPLPDRFKPSELDPLPVPQPNDKPSTTSLLAEFDSGDDDDDDDPDELLYRTPRWWGFAFAGIVLLLAALVVRFVREL